MCGIAGIISGQPDKLKDVQQMISCMSHRGPDGEATWENKTSIVALGHRRLSIIDLSSVAAQPMHYSDRYTIVHNGEIYNYKELRDRLSAKGYAFRSHSDTEIILASYDLWKEECLQYFDGMFAFAIWDEQEQKMFAARDRFGEKPFYYIHTEGSFYFASEIKALRKTGIDKSYNGNLLLQYFANGFVQDVMDPGATFDNNIKKLPARHYLRYTPSSQELQIIPYFDIDKSYSDISAEEAVKRFKELFFSSVQRRLRSDVEIGTSLSGGLDSSSVVAAIHHLKQTGVVQKAFTASFPGFEKDETMFAATIAKQFGLQHFIVSPSANDLVADLEKFLLQHDEPVSSSSVYAQYKVYELAKQHSVKVLLDGQGADEVLAGYAKYIHWYLQELYSGDKSRFRKESEVLQAREFNIKNKLAAKFPSWAAVQLEKNAIKKQKQLSFVSKDFIDAHLSKGSIYKPPVKSLNDILYFDVFGGGLEELLRNADRNAMAHGIEARLPFLEHTLVQFIFSLPSLFKIHKGYAKYILRQAMDDMLPKEIAWRKDKVGFEPPQQQWMQNVQLQEKVHEAKKKLVAGGILKPSILNTAVDPKAAHEADNYDWRFLCAAQLI
jgi:asparagine synthase (glutamine-hydrolysing)